MAANSLSDLISIMIAASKDKVYVKTVEKMQQAFHELILAEADSRRDKVSTLICSMAKIDSEVIRFKREYTRVSAQLSPDAVKAIDNYLKIVEQKKKDIVYEKNSLKKRRYKV